MVNYKVTISNGNFPSAGTMSRLYIRLVGTGGESERTCISWGFSLTWRNSVTSLTVSCPDNFGKPILIKLDKQHLIPIPFDSWFPAKVKVKSPEGETYIFPIYRWIKDKDEHIFREGTAKLISEDSKKLVKLRKKELEQQQEDYVWQKYGTGIPGGMKAESYTSLPYEAQFSLAKYKALVGAAAKGVGTLTWDEINRWFTRHDAKTDPRSIPDYVQEHWQEDAFFAYQYLNAVNPTMIRRCSALPENFPAREDILSGQLKLEEEMKKGNIFLCDYKRFHGVKQNVTNETQQFLMAPLVLLHKTPDDKLMPVAIQLKQTPAAHNPIFYPPNPTDPPNPTESVPNWLMAKIYVRSAEFNEQELDAHLLRTHLLAEVFAVSLLRNIPMVHPLYKLLLPHTHYTLSMNYFARHLLISEDGFFGENTSSGGDVKTILEKSMSAVTYSSLCINPLGSRSENTLRPQRVKDDIDERGLKKMPNFHYRDDGLRLWDIINKFVEGVLSFYYKSDTEVKNDSELQKWILEIFKYGFLSKPETGIPKSFTTVAELVKFVTMVIFTCSGQHSAVNAGQFDFSWSHNTPVSMQRPPPTTQGTTTKENYNKAFPDFWAAKKGVFIMYILSNPSPDRVLLGKFTEELFIEDTPRELIKGFQDELQKLSAVIKERNEKLDIPYPYMDPAEVENSVAI